MQHGTKETNKDDIAYDIDDKSFVLLIDRIPNAKHTLDLSRRMIEATRKIEKNLIAKLNCVYFAARKVSLPSIEVMLKQETQQNGNDMYTKFSD